MENKYVTRQPSTPSKALHCCLVLVLLLGDVEEIDNVCKLF